MQPLFARPATAAAPLFAALADFNLSLAAVLAGDAAGEVYVDDPADPRVGLATTSEGHYLAGDPEHAASYAGLRAVLPANAYLIFDPPGWEARLPLLGVDPAARRHARQHLRYQVQPGAAPTPVVPAGFELVPVTPALLARTDLRNLSDVADWVDSWRSRADFFQRGFGFGLIQAGCLASYSLTDCVTGTRCEIGVRTDAAFRRRGLGRAVVAAAVAHAAARGLTEVGWHCLSGNAGSLAVAEKIGFGRDRHYLAYSAYLPAENPGDLTPDEYAEWAAHYERQPRDVLRYAFRAAEAWAMAGDKPRALANLQRLLDGAWAGQPAWLTENWRLRGLRGEAVYEALLARLRASADKA